MGAKKKILIIEDDSPIRETLVEFLEMEGFETTSAENGQVGLTRLQDEPAPNLILLDLMMPVMDGLQFRMRQLEDPKMRDIPVVIMSADGHAPQKIGHLGKVSYLKKPSNLQTILDVIANNCT